MYLRMFSVDFIIMKVFEGLYFFTVKIITRSTSKFVKYKKNLKHSAFSRSKH